MSGNCELGRGLRRREKNANKAGAGRFEKPAPDARAAPPKAHESLISRKTVGEVPLTGLSFAIQNFPTVGLIDGVFRQNLEETGMSYSLEVDCIAAAHSLDLLTTPYVFNVEEAKLMTNAGAGIIVAHMGLTTNGSIGAQTAKSLQDCVGEVQAIVDTCKAIRDDVLVLCHGGPIATPQDAAFMLSKCKSLDGFYGASSMERLPTEIAITKQIRQFTALNT